MRRLVQQGEHRLARGREIAGDEVDLSTVEGATHDRPVAPDAPGQIARQILHVLHHVHRRESLAQGADGRDGCLNVADLHGLGSKKPRRSGASACIAGEHPRAGERCGHAFEILEVGGPGFLVRNARGELGPSQFRCGHLEVRDLPALRSDLGFVARDIRGTDGALLVLVLDVLDAHHRALLVAVLHLEGRFHHLPTGLVGIEHHELVDLERARTPFWGRLELAWFVQGLPGLVGGVEIRHQARTLCCLDDHVVPVLGVLVTAHLIGLARHSDFRAHRRVLTKPCGRRDRIDIQIRLHMLVQLPLLLEVRLARERRRHRLLQRGDAALQFRDLRLRLRHLVLHPPQHGFHAGRRWRDTMKERHLEMELRVGGRERVVHEHRDAIEGGDLLVLGVRLQRIDVFLECLIERLPVVERLAVDLGRELPVLKFFDFGRILLEQCQGFLPTLDLGMNALQPVLRILSTQPVCALPVLQPLDVLLVLVQQQDARIARRFGQRSEDVVILVHAGRVSLDDPDILVSLEERLDEAFLDGQHLPTPSVQAIGDVAVLQHGVPLVPLAVPAAVALLKIARAPRGVHVVHRPQVDLHVDANPKRRGLTDHHPDLGAVHRVRDLLFLLV